MPGSNRENGLGEPSALDDDFLIEPAEERAAPKGPELRLGRQEGRDLGAPDVERERLEAGENRLEQVTQRMPPSGLG